MATGVISLASRRKEAAKPGRGWRLPLVSELLAGLEWAVLRMTPLYYGIGVPHGDGSPVVLVPGFLGSDSSLLEMRLWLRRIGYHAYASGIGRNAECPDILIERLLETIELAYEETGRPVTLIGHSLGGLLARTAAARRPDRVSAVITMGSPFRRLSAHPLILSLIRLARGRSIQRHFSDGEGCCECSFVESLSRPLPTTVATASIYSRTDPVVDWRDCLDEDPTRNVEVRSTHIGLAASPAVYRHIAGLLAQPETVRQPDTALRSEPGRKRAASLQAGFTPQHCPRPRTPTCSSGRPPRALGRRGSSTGYRRCAASL